MTFSAAIGAMTEWARRIARVITFVMFALVPLHFFVSCEGSGIVGGFSLMLLFPVAGLSIVARRFKWFGLALLAMLLHSMSMH
jgi:hypothetical protein